MFYNLEQMENLVEVVECDRQRASNTVIYYRYGSICHKGPHEQSHARPLPLTLPFIYAASARSRILTWPRRSPELQLAHAGAPAAAPCLSLSRLSPVSGLGCRSCLIRRG